MIIFLLIGDINWKGAHQTANRFEVEIAKRVSVFKVKLQISNR